MPTHSWVDADSLSAWSVDDRSSTSTEIGPSRGWMLRREWGFLVGSMVVAISTGLFKVGARSFSLDEAKGVVYLSKGPLTELIRTLHNEEVNLAPYHLMLYGWKQLAVNEAGIRGLSIVFFVLSVPVTYALGRQILGKIEARLAALFVSIHGFAIEWAQEARGYSLLMLLSVLCCLAFVYVIRGKAASGYWFGLVGALAMLTHLFALMIFVGLLASLFIHMRDWRRWAPQLLRAAPFLVVSSIYVAWATLLNLAGGTAGIGWVPPVSVARIKGLLVQLGGGEIVSGILIVPLVAVTVLYISVRALHDRRWEQGSLMLVTWTAVPVMTTILVSIVGQPILVSRYLIGLVPLIALILGRAVTIPKGRWARGAVVLAVAIGLLYGAFGWYTAGSRGDFRAAAQIVAENSRPGEVVYLIPDYLHWPFDYYYPEVRRPNGPAVVGVPESSSALEDTLSSHAKTTFSDFWVVVRAADISAGESVSVVNVLVSERHELDELLLIRYSVPRRPPDAGRGYGVLDLRLHGHTMEERFCSSPAVSLVRSCHSRPHCGSL